MRNRHWQQTILTLVISTIFAFCVGPKSYGNSSRTPLGEPAATDFDATQQTPQVQESANAISPGAGGGTGSSAGVGGDTGLNPSARTLVRGGVTASDTNRANFKRDYETALQAKETAEVFLDAIGASPTVKLQFSQLGAGLVQTEGLGSAGGSTHPSNAERKTSVPQRPLEELRGAAPIARVVGGEVSYIPPANTPSQSPSTPASFGINNSSINAQPFVPVDGHIDARAVTGAEANRASQQSATAKSAKNRVELTEKDLEEIFTAALSGMISRKGAKETNRLYKKALAESKDLEGLVQTICQYGGVDPGFKPGDVLVFPKTPWMSEKEFLEKARQAFIKKSRERIRQAEINEGEAEYRSALRSFEMRRSALVVMLLLYVFIIAWLWKENRRNRRDDLVYFTVIGLGAALISRGSFQWIKPPVRPNFETLTQLEEETADASPITNSLASAGLAISLPSQDDTPQEYVKRFWKAHQDFNELASLSKAPNRVPQNINTGIEIAFGESQNIPISRKRCFADGHHIALASCGESDKKIILINKRLWAAASPEKRELVMMHELGHCALGREHATYWVERAGVRQPGSIMNPDESALSEKIYAQLREEYLTELFLNSR